PATGEDARVHAHGAAPRAQAGAREHVGAGPPRRRARRARQTEHVGVAGPAEGGSAGGHATDDLVPEQGGALLLGGAGDQVAFVDPEAVSANVALEEDGDALRRDPAEDAPRRADEKGAPTVES